MQLLAWIIFFSVQWSYANPIVEKNEPLEDEQNLESSNEINKQDQNISNESIIQDQQSNQKLNSKELSKNVLAEFLLNEVIPAFGSLEHIFLTNKPSFSIHFTKGGAELLDCSLDFRLKQIRPMKYDIANVEIYDFQASAEIGQSRWLFFKVLCGEKNLIINTNHFNFSFFVTDENFNKAPYNLKVKLLNQEQLDIKFWSLDLQTIIQDSEEEMLLGPYGNVESFSDSFSDYENEPGSYDIPLFLWPALSGKLDHSSIIHVEKVKIKKIIQLQGSAQLSFPTFENDVKTDTAVAMPVEGNIFISEDGKNIPVINFSMK